VSCIPVQVTLSQVDKALMPIIRQRLKCDTIGGGNNKKRKNIIVSKIKK
jgi:hypothetical protein